MQQHRSGGLACSVLRRVVLHRRVVSHERMEVELNLLCDSPELLRIFSLEPLLRCPRQVASVAATLRYIPIRRKITQPPPQAGVALVGTVKRAMRESDNQVSVYCRSCICLGMFPRRPRMVVITHALLCEFNTLEIAQGGCSHVGLFVRHAQGSSICHTRTYEHAFETAIFVYTRNYGHDSGHLLACRTGCNAELIRRDPGVPRGVF